MRGVRTTRVKNMTIKEIKKLVSDDNLRIELNDLIGYHLTNLFDAFDSEKFSNGTKYSPNEFKKRIEKCEALTEELCTIQALLGYWGTDRHSPLYTLSIENIANHLKDHGGNRAWIAVKWHALQRIFFYSGIAITARNDNKRLFRIFDIKIPSPASQNKKVSVPEALLYVNRELDSAYDNLIEEKNKQLPLRKYIYNQIKLNIDDVIYLGNTFEDVFYKFEIIFALEYISRRYDKIGENVWGPSGLFGFKQYGYNPFNELAKEAEQQKENWELIKAGFFKGDFDRFQKIYASFQERLHRFQW